MSRPSAQRMLVVVALAGATNLLAEPAAAGSIRGTVKLAKASQAERTVVYVENVPAGSFTATPKTDHLSQKGSIFKPAVLPIVRGGQVDMTNDDWVGHSVFSRSETKAFDLGIYAQEKRKIVTFETPGVVDVFCSIHPRMNAVILVLQNPFFTKPAPDGTFLIEAVPAGTYHLKTFTPGAPPTSATVTVPASGVVETQL